MDQEKLIFLTKRLQEERIVSFRLYNALYKITIHNENYIIQQDGLDTTYSYSSLTDLFTNYVLYGSSLIDCIHDIKMN